MAEKSLNILISTLGSHGDIHPFVGIGKELRQRGHRITFIAPAMYEALALRHGFEFQAVGTVEDFERLANNPDLWHPWRGIGIIIQGLLEMLEPYYRAIATRNEPGNTVSVHSTLVAAARIAQEKLAIPTVTVHLSPSLFRSIRQPPNLAPMLLRPWYPNWVKQLVFEIVDVVALDPLLMPRLNEFRASLGLKPVDRIFDQWLHSPQRVLGTFPDWFAPSPGDWPPQTVLTGFPLYDEADIDSLDDDLLRFLDAGAPPIAFTPGSAMRHAHKFFKSAVEACQILGHRGLLVTRHADHLPKNLPPEIRAVEYAPFSQLLPRCAVVVHHCGIGTSAQSLAAGIPQLATPMNHDQPDNADRLMRLGVSRTLPVRRFTARSAAAKLDELLRSPTIAAAAKSALDRLANTDGAAVAADWIERAIQSQL
ncbi:MAG: glycosyltransferase [Tepidisphaeraceae bacterium]|jgi:rhamnosyltransferase subunit B